MRLAYIILAIVILGCGADAKLSLLSKEETLNRILSGEINDFKFAPYKNENGKPLTKSESKLLNAGKLTRRYYQNQNRNIIEVRCIPASLEDMFYEIRLTEFLTKNPIKNFSQIPINCHFANIDSVYNSILEIDQGLRNGSV